ncbi:MAG: ABC transporter substrate-binding protein [Candidatus Acetothermia bacterium]
MKLFDRSLFLTCFLLLLVGLVTAPVMAQNLPEEPKVISEELNFGDNPQPGGDFVISTTAGPEGFNPVIATSTSTIAVTNMLFSRLFEINPISLEQEPELAKDWETSEDGRVYTFTLRKGVKWSDGEPLTADDVLFTFQDLHFNDDVESDTRSQLQVEVEGEKKLPEVEKVDEYTVRFTFPKVFAPALEGLTTPIMPKHALEDKVHKLNPDVSEGNFNEVWSLDTDPEDLVTCGPFVVEEFASGRHIILEKSPYSFYADEQGRQLPYLDQVTMLFVEDEETAVSKFLNGEVEALTFSSGNYPTLKKREPDNDFTVYRAGPDFGTSNNIGFNYDVEDEGLRELFRNVKFRRAMSYAFDEETVVDNVFNGLAEPQWGPISKANTLYHNPDLKEYKFDLEKAEELLDEIGVVDANGDGTRETPAGEELSFTLITDSGGVREEMATIFANDLKEIGVELNVQGQEFGSVINRMQDGDFEAVSMSLVGSRDPHGTAVNVFGSEGGFHYWHWSAEEDPTETEQEIDKLLSQATGTVDVEERQKLYGEYQRIMSEQLPVLFTVQPESLYAVWDQVGNIGETPSPYLSERRGSLFTPLAHLVYKRE